MQKRFALLAFAFVSSSAFAQLEVTDLGTLGGEQSFAFSINDANQIVGESRNANGETHIFLYDSGNLVDISAMNQIGPGEYASTAYGINNNGHIAGMISNGHAAVLTEGATTDLGTLGGIFSAALGVNNVEQAVGYFATEGFVNHAFVFSNGNLLPLGPFGEGTSSIAAGINDSGTIVGHASEGWGMPNHAFLYSNGVMLDISPYGNSESYAHAINNRGQVVGEFLNASQTAFHAFIYSNGEFTDIGSANSEETVAYGINDRSQAVGATWVRRPDTSRGANISEPHAFVYTDGVMTDLNSLLPPSSPWKLVAAYGINMKGKIVGYGLINGQYHGFLLSWQRLQPNPATRSAQPPLRAKGAAFATSSR